MSRRFFWSDTHFGHALVAGTRGFDSVAEHDAWLIEQVNATVGKRDTLILVGDNAIEGSWAHGLDCVRDFTTKDVRLISGNHDKTFAYRKDAHTFQREYLTAFTSVDAFARIRLREHTVLVSHFPYAGEGSRTGPERYSQYRLRNLGVPLIHGHTHSRERVSFADRAVQVHVGADAWPAPVSEDEVVATIENAWRAR